MSEENCLRASSKAARAAALLSAEAGWARAQPAEKRKRLTEKMRMGKREQLKVESGKGGKGAGKEETGGTQRYLGLRKSVEGAAVCFQPSRFPHGFAGLGLSS
jgi:hypothetical protein